MLNALHSDNGILCDTYADATFLWNEKNMMNQGTIPFKKPWIGILHHTQTEQCGDNNLVTLFKSNSFLLSLRQCKGLITLSQYTQKWLQNKLKAAKVNDVKVFTLKHPTESVPEQALFNLSEFKITPTVVQIGAWLRDPYAIYELNMPWAKKKVLEGSNMQNYMHPIGLTLRNGNKCIPGVCNVHVKHSHRSNHYTCMCFGSIDESIHRDDLSIQGQNTTMSRPPALDNILVQYLLHYMWMHYDVIMPDCVTVALSDGSGCRCGNFKNNALPAVDEIVNRNFESVTSIKKLSNNDYDNLLSRSVVFINLEDASAVNTIIECIIRNTPIIVNRLPAVVEYLGVGYPLYYDHINHVSTFTLANIQSATKYLMKMNKQDLMIDTFISKFKKILAQL
jgi:hypothetical protein